MSPLLRVEGLRERWTVPYGFPDPHVNLETLPAVLDEIPVELLKVDSPPMADFLESYISMKTHVQIRFGRWHDIIDEPTFADAILDRLIHNAHRLPLDGPSMRKTHDAPEAKNVDEQSDT